MSGQLSAAMAAGNIAEAATLAFAQAGLGVLSITELFGICGLLAGQDRPERAIALYQLWLRNCDTALNYAAHYNLAVLQAQTGDQHGAEQAYRAALALQPGFTEALLGLGLLLERQRRPEQALACWQGPCDRIAADGSPASALQLQLLNHFGRVAATLRRYPQAEAAWSRSLQYDPQQASLIPHWVALRQQQCMWPVLAPLPGLTPAQLLAACPLASTLNASDDPVLHLAAARRQLAALPPPQPPGGADANLSNSAAPTGYQHARLRIGYLSSDDDAALASLHDARQFDIYLFCNAGIEGTAARPLALPAPSLSIADLSDAQAAELIRAHQIDILVDLHGHDSAGRPGVLALRPAPVQINWPGQPASSGQQHVDYLLADATLLPPQLAASISEQPLYLPQLFQWRPRPTPPARRGRRSAHGLPASGCVFCCFAPSTQITASQFGCWMRILLRAPASVLWLQADDEALRDHLRLAALRHGVASERLVFAHSVPLPLQLARYQVADLFLDTLPHNAAGSASDALWAGLPLLSCSGHSLASRTGASLLQAAGLPQLHTTTLEAYQQLAVTLAHAPRRLAALRQHLRRQRQPGAPGPLFDTAAGIRQLERLYRRVARGSRPASDTATPLVSILLAVAADHNADAVERTLHSALAQHYPEVDIIVSDASASPAIEARIAPLLVRHPQLRYSRASGLTPAASLDHCLALALGEYIAIAPIGDTLHPNRLARMLDFYQRYPGVGLVACWRQPQDASGNNVAGAPGLAAETAVGGTSLAALLLAAEAATVDTLCDPGALLLRRATLSAGFGQYHGRRYQALGPVATVLAALAGGDYVYLPEPLGSRRSAASPSASSSALASLERTLEQLELMYHAHAQQLFASAPQRFAPLLAARLAACHSLLTSQHTALAPLPAPLRQRLDGLLQQGHQLLLG